MLITDPQSTIGGLDEVGCRSPMLIIGMPCVWFSV
jgi:hypothetical protein